MDSSRRRMVRAMLTGVALLLTSGCDGIVGSLTRAYPGPAPSQDHITEETVIVRTVRAEPGTGILFFYVDRVRYLETDPYNINRVVEVTSRDIHPAVEPLGLKVGDRIQISTQFLFLSPQA